MFAAMLSLASFPFVAAAEPADDAAGKERAYVVESRLIDKRSGKEQSRRGPRMTVFEGQKANVNDLVQRPFVVAVSPPDGSLKPVIEVLNDGWRVDYVCHASGPDHVLLDLTIERAEISEVKELKLAEGITVQQPQVAIAKARRFESVRPGEPVMIPLDGKPDEKSELGVELVVTRMAAE
jgi:hypothetical protein